jgi:hypothetical protein
VGYYIKTKTFKLGTVAEMDRLLRAVSSFFAKQNIFGDPIKILTFTAGY